MRSISLTTIDRLRIAVVSDREAYAAREALCLAGYVIKHQERGGTPGELTITGERVSRQLSTAAGRNEFDQILGAIKDATR